MTRRSTVDWVLQRTAAAEPRVTVRFGVQVTGLLPRPDARRQPPHVTGVRTDRGDLAADLVVDATGRRSPIDDWLAQIGARPTATWRAECGMAYFSRHYRVRPGAELPGLLATRIVVGARRVPGRQMGRRQRCHAAGGGAAGRPTAGSGRSGDPEVFTAVLRTIPTYAAWLEVMDPITGVFPMAGLHNTLRRLVVDGTPVATGLHAIGDSVCTTNPTLGPRPGPGPGRRRRPGRHHRRARRRSRRAGARPGPSGRRARGAVLPGSGRDRCHAAGDDAAHHLRRPPPPPPSETPGRVTYSQLRVAASYDPAAFRAFWKINGMVCPPEEVYTDPDVVACTQETLRRHGNAPPVAQPAREQLLTALAR